MALNADLEVMALMLLASEVRATAPHQLVTALTVANGFAITDFILG